MKFIKELKRKTRIFTTKAEISIIMKNENYLLTLSKIIPLYYEDVQGLPIRFPLFPFLNGIIYSLLYNRKYAFLFSFLGRGLQPTLVSLDYSKLLN